MSSCAAEDNFHLFIKAVQESDLGASYIAIHPLVLTLERWERDHGFPSAATWTKKILVGVLAPSPANEFWASLGWGYDEGATILSCFGQAFAGDEVGLLGRDILEPCLQHEDDAVAAAAYDVLGSWLEDSNSWQSLVDRLDQEEEEYDDEVQQLALQGFEDEEDLAEFKEALEEQRQALEPYFEARRSCPNSLRARVQHVELPGFLERTLGLHRDISLGLLESQKIGYSCVRESTLQVHLERGIARAWNAEVTVSIEPTATSGSWLVFASWS